MSKDKDRETLDAAEKAARDVKPVTPPPPRPMQPDSGVERDFREAEGS
jgi:hypothetical protein